MRDDFVSTTAHEFHTPLTAIIGFCELLQMDETLPPAVRCEYLDIISERGEFLSRLVDRFLDVSRIDSGRASAMAASIAWLRFRKRRRHGLSKWRKPGRRLTSALN